MDSPKEFLDNVMERICRGLQITDSQYSAAKERYRAVGEWLADEESPLAKLSPSIYPQGSMALQTTVKPRAREEYDLDMVLHVATFAGEPTGLYQAAYRRLMAHGEYAKRLETRSRCIRIIYAKQFHLDIVPARLDRTRGGSCIEVPDHTLKCWKPSNPRGYLKWFESRCAQLIALERAEISPLPDNTPAHDKPVLKRAVQLLKRHRDVLFEGHDGAPSSMVLTTLAGIFYQGETSLTQALSTILNGVVRAIRTNWPKRIKITNPSNHAEDLCESWTDQNYQNFFTFIRNFRDSVETLVSEQGVDRIGTELEALFGDETLGGEDVASMAIRGYVEEVKGKREAGGLRLRASSLTMAAGAGLPIPRNTFYGR